MIITEENKPYELLSGQRMTEEEFKKYEVVMRGQIIARWMTAGEMAEAIEQSQNEGNESR